MRLTIVAMGRARGGPEAALVADYLGRAGRTGRALGLSGASLTEVEPRRGQTESQALDRALPEGAVLVVLDERGQMLDSPGFATRLAGWRDAGRREVALAIGGADGHDPALLGRADLVLSFGPMVWPHMLARAMLAEQIYRATAILAGTPYHRA